MEYDKEYAEARIKNHQSGLDILRKDYIIPYFSRVLNSSVFDHVIDVGCGWGMILPLLRKGVFYHGVDTNPYFFPFLKDTYGEKISLLSEGSLPSLACSSDYDIVVCSLVLHCVGDLSTSIASLISLMNPNGRLYLVDFRTSIYPRIKGSFLSGGEEKKLLFGSYELPSGTIVDAEVYCHSEFDYESILESFGLYFEKEYLGDYFVAYVCRK